MKIIIRPVKLNRPVPVCRALIQMDSSRLKQEEQKKCKNLYLKLESTRKTLEKHEAQSVPEYLKWSNSRFGAQLTEIRGYVAQFHELQLLIGAVEAKSFFSGCSQRKAYEAIMQLKAKGDEFSREFDGDSSGEAGEPAGGSSRGDRNSGSQSGAGGADAFKKATEAFEEEMKNDFIRAEFEKIYGTKKRWRYRGQTYEDAFEHFKVEFNFANDFAAGSDSEFDPEFDPEFDSEFGSEFDSEFENDFENDDFDPFVRWGGSKASGSSGSKSRFQHGKQNSAQGESPDSQSRLSRLKDQYRGLARKLHPDLNPGLEPQQLALWYQVQAAYEAQDLPRLEALGAMNEMDDRDWEKIDGISALRSFFLKIKNALQEFEKKMRSAKKDKSWDFHSKMKHPKKMAVLEQEMEKELKQERYNLQLALKELELIVDDWKKPPKKRRGKK